MEERGRRAGVVVWIFTTVMLFGVSSAYHLGAGVPSVNQLLNHLDHANIYLFIAGTYTPFAAALSDPRSHTPSQRRVGGRRAGRSSAAVPLGVTQTGWG